MPKLPGERFAFISRYLMMLTCITALAWSSAAIADGSSAPYAGGGRIQPGQIIAKYNKSGERFRMTGNCQSSCTMLLAIKNVCIEPSARLLFHAALFPNERGQKPPPARQAAMLNSYKPKLRKYLVDNHYVDTFEFHTISGREMIDKFGYPECR